jgi:hypothetical protein
MVRIKGFAIYFSDDYFSLHLLGKFDSRGSPSTSAMSTPTLTLIDAFRLEGLMSTSATTTLAFTLVA